MNALLTTEQNNMKRSIVYWEKLALGYRSRSLRCRTREAHVSKKKPRLSLIRSPMSRMNAYDSSKHMKDIIRRTTRAKFYFCNDRYELDAACCNAYTSLHVCFALSIRINFNMIVQLQCKRLYSFFSTYCVFSS